MRSVAVKNDRHHPRPLLPLRSNRLQMNPCGCGRSLVVGQFISIVVTSRNGTQRVRYHCPDAKTDVAAKDIVWFDEILAFRGPLITTMLVSRNIHFVTRTVRDFPMQT